MYRKFFVTILGVSPPQDGLDGCTDVGPFFAAVVVTQPLTGEALQDFVGLSPFDKAMRRFDKRPRLGHNAHMSAIAKSRIDPELKRQAEAVLEEIGLKPRAALELFYKQIIKRRAIPFPVQADSPEDEVLSTATRRNKLADEF